MKKRYIVVLAALVAMFIGVGHSVRSQVSHVGLDVLFLVDQSGGMCGEACGYPQVEDPTDPQGLRFQGVQAAIDWLGYFRAQQAEVGNLLDINVSVIHFGDQEPETALGWEEGKIDPASLEEWETKRSTLLNRASQESFGPRNLGNTDFIWAFDAAFASYDTLNASDLDSYDRLQTIIVLTDGTPCAPSRGEWINLNCTYTGDQDTHMTNLANNARRAFNRTNQRVYVVAIDANNLYWPIYEALWQKVALGGSAARLESADDIGLRFNDILNDLVSTLIPEKTEGAGDVVFDLGNRVELSAGAEGAAVTLTEYEVRPFQQRMVIWLFKSNIDSHLALYEPTTGRRVDYQNDIALVSGRGTAIEVWRVDNPMPGVWKLGAEYLDRATNQLVADADASVSIDFVQARFVFSVPESLSIYQPVLAEIQVVDLQGTPLPSYPNAAYELQGHIHVVPPSGAENALDVPIAARGNGLYTAQFTPLEAGTYAIFADTGASYAQGAVTFAPSAPSMVEIMPVEVVIDGLDPAAPKEVLQETPQTYQLFIHALDGSNAEGIEIQSAALTFLAENEVDCANPGADAETQPFIPEGGVFTLNTRHMQSGSHVVCLTMDILDPLTDIPVRIVDRQRYGLVDVTQVEKLALSLTLPKPVTPAEPGSETIWEYERWPTLKPEELFRPTSFEVMTWEPTQTKVQMVVVDAANPTRPVPVAQEIEGGMASTSDDFFTFEILDRERGNVNLAQELGIRLHRTDDQAIWEVQLPQLEPGTYDIRVTAPLRELSTGSTRAFADGQNYLELTLVVEETDTVLPIKGGLSVIAGLLTLVIGERTTRRFRASRHPATGKLEFRRRLPHKDQLDPDWSVPVLDLNHNRNRVEFLLAELPLVEPPLTGLQVFSPRWLSRENAVKVKVWVQGKPQELLLRPNEPQPIYTDAQGYTYEIVKDPSL